MAKTAQMGTVKRGTRATVSPPASRLARTAAYYKLFTTTMFVLLGTIIVARSIAEGGALGLLLIGVCLAGLGIARWVAIWRARASR